MLFILRLTNGDSVVTTALNERDARENALKLGLENSTEIATVRPLAGFSMQLSPTDEGSLEVVHWEDCTLDDILASEYPLLEEAYRRANTEPFSKLADRDEPILAHLKAANERNKEIIREGLRLELERFSQQKVTVRSSARSKNARTRS